MQPLFWEVRSTILGSTIRHGIAVTTRVNLHLDPMSWTLIFVGKVGCQMLVCIVCGITVERAMHLPNILDPWGLCHHFKSVRTSPFMWSVINNGYRGVECPHQLRCNNITMVRNLVKIYDSKFDLGTGQLVLDVNSKVTKIDELKFSERQSNPWPRVFQTRNCGSSLINFSRGKLRNREKCRDFLLYYWF